MQRACSSPTVANIGPRFSHHDRPNMFMMLSFIVQSHVGFVIGIWTVCLQSEKSDRSDKGDKDDQGRKSDMNVIITMSDESDESHAECKTCMV